MLVHCWRECKLVQPLWKTGWRFLKDFKMELPYGPAILELVAIHECPHGLYLNQLSEVREQEPIGRHITFCSRGHWYLPWGERERLCVCVCVMNQKIRLEGSARQAGEGGWWRGNVVQPPWSVSPASWKLQIRKASREAGKEPSSTATQGPSRHVRPKSTEAS